METHQGIRGRPSVPEIAPPQDEDSGEVSSLSISVVEGTSLNLWSIATATEGETKGELTLQLQPDQAVVIGRQEGGRIEYLDPRYQPTQLLPDSTRRVVASQQNEPDGWVSRGHFMLKGTLHGILLVNGVPRQGGGIRPPKNGTVLLEPDNRHMHEGEDYMIELGKSAKIRLPNGTVILLSAA